MHDHVLSGCSGRDQERDPSVVISRRCETWSARSSRSKKQHCADCLVLKADNQARAVAATLSGDRRATTDGAAGQSERYREWSRW